MNSDTLNSYNDTLSSVSSLRISKNAPPTLPVEWGFQNMQNMQSIQNMQNMQNMQKMQQNMQSNMPNMQNNIQNNMQGNMPNSAQGLQNMQNMQNMQNQVQANGLYNQRPANGTSLTPGNVRNEAPKVKMEAAAARASAQVKQGLPVKGPEERDILSAATGANSRWNSWSHDEEVFLVAAVFDRLYRRGSLASSTKGENKDCWTNIKVFYDKVWAKHSNGAVNHNVERSTTALSRHYKIMKERASQAEKAGHYQLYFKVFLQEWENVYNKDNKLINPRDLQC